MGDAAMKTGIAWCALGRIAGAQVPGIAIDPHMLVLTAAKPAGQITVLNPHSSAAEFSVDLRFGFATTDSAGQPRVELAASADGASAADWITPHPRHFTLRPGATRAVRLLADPPAGLPNGEYWARLTVHAHDRAPALTDAAPASDPHARIHITLETATIIPVFFRKGPVSTGLAVDSIRAELTGDTIDVSAALTRIGNAAFLGLVRLVARDSAGAPIGSLDRQLAVYRSASPRWRITLPRAALPTSYSPAPYYVTAHFSTNRRDVDSRLVVQAASFQRTMPVLHRALVITR